MTQKRTGFNPIDLVGSIKETVMPGVTSASRLIKPVERAATSGALLLTAVPKQVQAAALAPVLNHALQELVEHGEFDFLTGHICAIAVQDRNLAWHIGFNGKQLTVEPQSEPDVSIRASVPAFLNLISQHADPDTLFFQRQLSIEGNVELGLYIKNLLDAMDDNDLPVIWRRGLLALRTLLTLETSGV